MITPATTELPINTGVPTKEEIRKAIRKLNNGKAAGPDSMGAEVLKFDEEVSANMLEILLKQLWMDEEVPVEWQTGHIVRGIWKNARTIGE